MLAWGSEIHATKTKKPTKTMPTRAGFLSAYVLPGPRCCDRPCVSSTTRSVGELNAAGAGDGKKIAGGR
jgi:hypothetical protein